MLSPITKSSTLILILTFLAPCIVATPVGPVSMALDTTTTPYLTRTSPIPSLPLSITTIPPHTTPSTNSRPKITTTPYTKKAPQPPLATHGDPTPLIIIFFLFLFVFITSLAITSTITWYRDRKFYSDFAEKAAARTAEWEHARKQEEEEKDLEMVDVDIKEPAAAEVAARRFQVVRDAKARLEEARKVTGCW
ncbi:hypothetical protein BJ875DRAFT_519651 [Amylocarpus encephaloides]|uniref:Uncharacterized protein n=1 Tax=Amylocarpus encephaloides TaxID=45428 RepID=A0A9P7YBG7_9HELO|nr:hypothetical protein BJ875DRAFT_519651 [Amylocarpus encephaloides]